MRIDLNVNICGLEAISKDRYLALVEQLHHLEILIMTTNTEFQASFERLNTATTAIANILAGISANIGNMTAEEEDAAKAQLDAAVASLEAMAVTPTDPVPVPVPEEPTP